MTPEEKDLLERTYELTKENSELLRKLNRTRVWAIAWRVTYWAIILLLSLGAYYFIQPYIEAVRGVLPGFSEAVNNFQSLTQ